MDLILVTLLFASIAAGTAALGVLPLVGHDRLHAHAVGWANALAAGFMLGGAYLLMTAGPDFGLGRSGLGAAAGIALVWLSHVASGTADRGAERSGTPDEAVAYKALLVNALHAAPEGVAIGAAMMVSVPFGVFIALAMAVHNIPEAAALAETLRSRGVDLASSAALGVLTNVTQVLLAVVAAAVVTILPGALPWALGFAVGGLIYLVMSDLLPECYHRAGRRTIALVTIVAMGIVVLAGGLGR